MVDCIYIDPPYNSGATVTVKPNAFTAPSGKQFDHWNTSSTDNGTSYNPGTTFTISSDITDSPLSLAHWALTGPVVLLVFSAENVGLAKKFVQVFHKILQENPNELLANPIYGLETTHNSYRESYDFFDYTYWFFMGLPWCFRTKESAGTAGDAADVDLIPQSGRSFGGGNDRSLQYFCLGNPMATKIQSIGSQRIGHD